MYSANVKDSENAVVQLYINIGFLNGLDFDIDFNKKWNKNLFGGKNSFSTESMNGKKVLFIERSQMMDRHLLFAI